MRIALLTASALKIDFLDFQIKMSSWMVNCMRITLKKEMRSLELLEKKGQVYGEKLIKNEWSIGMS